MTTDIELMAGVETALKELNAVAKYAGVFKGGYVRVRSSTLIAQLQLDGIPGDGPDDETRVKDIGYRLEHLVKGDDGKGGPLKHFAQYVGGHVETWDNYEWCIPAALATVLDSPVPPARPQPDIVPKMEAL